MYPDSTQFEVCGVESQENKVEMESDLVTSEENYEEYVPLDVVLSFARAESLLKTWQAIGYPPHQSTKTLPTDFMLRRPGLRQAIFRLDEMLKTEVGNIWTTIAENLSAASTGEGHASASS